MKPSEISELRYHQDPSHGWIEIPFTHLRQLGIANCISPYSYKRRDICYLEEDLDADTLIKALLKAGQKQDIHYRFIDQLSNKTSFIRDLPSYPSSENWRENLKQFQDSLQPVTP